MATADSTLSKLQILTPTAFLFEIEVSLDQTVRALRNELKRRVEVDDLILLFKAQALALDKTLRECGMEENSTVQLCSLRLLLKARAAEFLSGKRSLVTISKSTSLFEALTIMKEERLNALPVLDEFGSCIGCIDVRHVCLELMRATPATISDILAKQISDLPSTHPYKAFSLVKADDAIAKIVAYLIAGQHRIGVMDKEGKTLIHVISQSDVLNAFIRASQGIFIPPLERKLGECGFGTSPVETLPSETAFRTALETLVSRNISAAPIIDEDSGRILGNFSATDIRLFIDPTMHDVLDSDILSFVAAARQRIFKDVFPSVVCRESDSVRSLLERLWACGIHRIYLVNDDRRPIRVISLKDVLKFVFDAGTSQEAIRAATPRESEFTLSELLEQNMLTLSGGAREFVQIESKTKAGEAFKLMQGAAFSALPVYVAESRKFSYWLESRDVVKWLHRFGPLNPTKRGGSPLKSPTRHGLRARVGTASVLTSMSVDDLLGTLLGSYHEFNPCSPEVTVREVVRLLASERSHRVPIVATVEEGGVEVQKLLKIITQSDVVHLLCQNSSGVADLLDKSVEEAGLGKSEVISVCESASLEDGLSKLVKSELFALPVVSTTGKIVTVISVTDFRCAVALGNFALFECNTVIEFVSKVRMSGLQSFVAHVVCKVGPHVCISDADKQSTDPLKVVLSRLEATRVHRLYVVDAENRPIGVIGLRDLVEHLLC